MNICENQIASSFENSTVITENKSRNCAEVEWSQHPVFCGVDIKKLVLPEECNGAFSSLLVRVQAGCELKEHVHEGQWEMHEVISGSGESTLGEQGSKYSSGSIAIIPKGVKHSVKAGSDGLVILAKFF